MKWLRWIALVFVAIVAFITITGFTLHALGGQKLARTLDVEVYPVEIPSDSASIAEGGRLAQVLGCTDCHGEKLEGRMMVDDPVFGRLVAPHIAPGSGSVTAGYTEDDWLRAVRHGVRPDGRPLVLMPSSEYHHLVSAGDIGNVIAYAMRAEPVDSELPRSELRLAQVLIGAGVFKLEPDKIDHGQAPRTRPAEDDAMALGEYMAATCRGCHGADLMGLDDPNMGGPRLARGGVIDAWSEDDFMRMLDTGATPDGRTLDPARMPWRALGQMTEAERRAVWAYLQTVEPPGGP